jgi:hypothetical protein
MRKSIYRRADHQDSEGARSRAVGQQAVPEVRCQRCDVLQPEWSSATMAPSSPPTPSWLGNKECDVEWHYIASGERCRMASWRASTADGVTRASTSTCSPTSRRRRGQVGRSRWNRSARLDRRVRSDRIQALRLTPPQDCLIRGPNCRACRSIEYFAGHCRHCKW